MDHEPSDLIGDVIACLLSKLGVKPEDVEPQIDSVQAEIRQTWGGERVLVTKTSPKARAERRKIVEIAAIEVASGEKQVAAASRYGVTRHAIYRTIRLGGPLNRK